MSIEISADMYLFAEGYHDGRMDYEYNPPYIDDDEYYLKGYEAGINERTEQDERG